MYKYWFRVEWDGLEKIPTHGGALLIANHAGAIPSDAPAIMHGIEEELGRPVYGLADYFFRTIPVVGHACGRGPGGCPPTPTTPTACCTTSSSWPWCSPREPRPPPRPTPTATGSAGSGGAASWRSPCGPVCPIIPIAVVGAEESMPILFRLGGVAKLFNLPYFPVTANALLMGPLGYVTYFPAKFKLRVLDPVTFDVEPGLERYSRSRVMDEAEGIRAKHAGRPPRHAAGAPQRLVRLSRWVAGS